MSFSRIVVAVDGSAACAPALAQALWLARRGDASLTGLFVLDSGWADFIGNDWQSSGGARAGFLDHVGREQQGQAQAARSQFEQAADGLAGADFRVLTGDPATVLLGELDRPETDLLIFGRRTFQVCGRPSLKGAAATLAKRGKGALLLLP
jgi:nucleotide-binding universal stress UspA family protein